MIVDIFPTHRPLAAQGAFFIRLPPKLSQAEIRDTIALAGKCSDMNSGSSKATGNLLFRF